MTASRAWSAPVGLFLVALCIRLLVIPLVSFAPNEGAQYYVSVAENLVHGRGLVSDAVWSYATPPQTVPKPAFELWLPMATFVAAIPMAIAGASLHAAQAGMALLGAAIAPIAWWVGREAASVSRLDGRRTAGVAITAGLLAAVLAPFVTAVAGPDSTTPFLVFGTLSAILAPAALPSAIAVRRHAWLPGLGFGVALGLAYLSRQEAIWIALAWLALVALDARRTRSRSGRGSLLAALGPVILGGLLVVLPWLVRNTIDLGGPLPGQAIENLWLRRNEDIFAWLDRPTASGYLGRGVGALLADRVDAALHQLLSVLVTPAFPIGLLGLVAVVALRRSPALRRPTGLVMLLLSGGLTFAGTALLFPVATLWGTFLHAAGPLLVGLIGATALATDTLMARVSTRRGWSRVNVVIGPVALLAVSVPLLGLQLLILSRQTSTMERRVAAVVADLTDRGVLARDGTDTDPTDAPVLVTDHPMWLAAASRARAIVLPDEPLPAVADLARTHGASWLVIFGDARERPQTLLDAASPCLDGPVVRIGTEAAPAMLVRTSATCTTP